VRPLEARNAIVEIRGCEARGTRPAVKGRAEMAWRRVVFTKREDGEGDGFTEGAGDGDGTATRVWKLVVFEAGS